MPVIPLCLPGAYHLPRIMSKHDLQCLVFFVCFLCTLFITYLMLMNKAAGQFDSMYCTVIIAQLDIYAGFLSGLYGCYGYSNIHASFTLNGGLTVCCVSVSKILPVGKYARHCAAKVSLRGIASYTIYEHKITLIVCMYKVTGCCRHRRTSRTMLQLLRQSGFSNCTGLSVGVQVCSD